MVCDTASVLIVEDEAFVAWDLSQAIELSGKAVVGPASTLSVGLSLVDDAHVCAAVLDINLGEETVWPLADSLQERGIPFGFVSANLRHPELEGRFSSAPKLSKPVRERDLLSMVDELIVLSSCRA